MLAGRYPSDEFAELRPRIVWDRTAGVIRGRSGARRLAVTNAGTIPDRGLFGVFLVEGGGRVGELDEEMVYEARAGQTFLLGASTWRIEEITRDRVLVSPAPGVPGAVPFWKGEGVGRPYELGAAIGRTSRELVGLTDEKMMARLQADHRLDERAAKNLLTFLREQAEATGAVPSDRTVVIEKFRDEIGDWRVCVLTPFGARIHAPWAMAMTARLRDGLGVDAQSIWSDDGIALHFPDADQPPPVEELLDRPRPARGPRCRRARPDGALRRALPRERVARAADPAPLPGQAHAALAAAAQGAEPAAGRAQVRLVPGHPRDVPRVPAGRLRPAGAQAAAPGHPHARARSRRDRDRRQRRRTRPRCSSTTSRRTCTRTTRLRRSAVRRRCRSTATCCASCSARRSCATCSTRARSRRSSRSCAARRRTSTGCTTCCSCAGTCSRASTTPASPRRCCASGA